MFACACLTACVCVSVWLFLYVSLGVFICARLFVCECVSLCVCVCMFVYLHACGLPPTRLTSKILDALVSGGRRGITGRVIVNVLDVYLSPRFRKWAEVHIILFITKNHETSTKVLEVTVFNKHPIIVIPILS